MNSGHWIFGYLYFFFFFFPTGQLLIILLFVPSCRKKILSRHWPPEDTSDSNKCIFPCIFSCLCPQNCEWNMVLRRRNFRLWLSKRSFYFGCLQIWLPPKTPFWKQSAQLNFSSLPHLAKDGPSLVCVPALGCQGHCPRGICKGLGSWKNCSP